MLGIMIGLLIGLVLFGGGGFAVAKMTSSPTPEEQETAQPAPSASLPAYETAQLAINRTKVTGNLVAFSETWLPYLSGCSNNDDSDGPDLNTGEVSRVSCERGGVTVVFIEYQTVSDRDKVRTRVLSQNIDARTMTTGVAEPVENKEENTGYYIEYASESSSGIVYAGIWWDDAVEPVAAYITTPWVKGLNSDWEPIRDLWSNPH